MDLALLNNNVISQTIGVRDAVTSGDKSITIVVVDKNGQEHEIETTLTVKSKTAIGGEDFGFDEARIYFTVTDRFFNGDESNDDPNGNNYDKSNPFTYHGGDLKLSLIHICFAYCECRNGWKQYGANYWYNSYYARDI